MADSYNQIVTRHGNLISNNRFAGMIESLDEAYEMIEELYGMLWFLAAMGPDSPPMSPADLVEQARQNWKTGLKLSEQFAERKSL